MSDETDDMEGTSPPYPKTTATAVGLYKALEYFLKWFAHHRKSSPCQCKDNPIKNPRGFISLERHCDLPVARLAMIAEHVRQLRVAWDSLVREFEDEWDSERCKEAVHFFLHHVALSLDSVHLSNELLEAKRAEAARRTMFVAIDPAMLERMNAEDHEDDDPADD